MEAIQAAPRQEESTEQRVLIVDDEPMARRSLGRILSGAGFDCQFAGDTDEALRWLEEHQFTLVLSDLVMPGRSGMELAEEVNGRYPDTEVILLTGAADTNIGEMAIEHGVFGFLSKPFKPADVVTMVRSALHWKAREERQRDRLREMESSIVHYSAEVARLNDQLRRVRGSSYEGILHSLARAGALKDDEPERHLKRMSNYAALIAEGVGMTERECDQLRIAAITHDIGKIGVPEAILLKPGARNPAEHELMRKHTTLGRKIHSSAAKWLEKEDPASAEVITLAASIAQTHHERYDGSGYPMALHRDRIPLEGRICIIADVFDAMTSQRVYRPALPVEEAVKFLEEQSGQMFDPALVEIFVGKMDEVLEIKKQYCDEPAAPEAETEEQR